MLVRDLMTSDPATIVVTARVRDAVERLQALEVRHLPVVDEAGELVGMLSDRDLRDLAVALLDPDAADSSSVRKLNAPIGDVMSGGVQSVIQESDAREVAELIVEHRIGAVPVTDGEGQLVGIVSYIDLLREASFD